MSSRTLIVFAVLGIALFLIFDTTPPAKPPVSPHPIDRDDDDDEVRPPKRRRCPGPGPCPRELATAGHKPVVGGLTSPDGKTTINIPIGELTLKKNISSGGLGCCGSRSLEYSARNVGVTALYDLPEKMRKTGISGGDNMETIARKMRKFAPEIGYIQDVHSTLSVLSAIVATQRIACVGYDGHDPHYSGHIMHCVCVVAADLENDWIAVLDNNFPSTDQIVWMGKREFRDRWKGCLDCWLYTLLAVRPGALPQLGGKPVAHGADSDTWKRFTDIDDEYSLWRADVQIGNWRCDSRRYYPRLSPGKWGEPTDPPVPPPQWPDYPAIHSADGGTNYGLTLATDSPFDSPTINGKAATRAELLEAIGPALVPVQGPEQLLTRFKQFVATERGKMLVGLVAVGIVLIVFAQGRQE